MPGNGSSARASAHRVLVIDSDRAMRRLLTLALEDFGCEGYEARDGPETLGVLGDHAMCAVIVDIPGPGVSRWSVLEALGGPTNGRRPATIAISSDHAALAVATERGIDATLLKPFSLRQLQAAIEQLVAREESLHTPTTPFCLRSTATWSRHSGGTPPEPISQHTTRSQRHG